MEYRPEHATGPGDHDADLLLHTAAGDRAAFDELVARNRRWVYNLVYRYVGDAAEAEDLTQDAFVRLYLSRSTYRPTARFATYFHRIVVNLCINEARRRRRHPAEPMTGAEAERSSPASGPAQAAEQRELAAEVMAALQDLLDSQRMAVVLNRYEGLSYAEVAEVMGVSVKAVEALLHRAKQSLMRQLSGYVAQAG